MLAQGGQHATQAEGLMNHVENYADQGGWVARRQQLQTPQQPAQQEKGQPGMTPAAVGSILGGAGPASVGRSRVGRGQCQCSQSGSGSCWNHSTGTAPS